ncbi:response regulator [Acidithiobacillus sp. IBUN Pt1247-S3]|uniref:response regulator n=1 Tax=Acidithiobacillus sp. IBUN Pt1247-S3 TaxID=3166642 RepID=UPI0034E3B532
MAHHDVLLVEDDPGISQFMRSAFRGQEMYHLEHVDHLAAVQQRILERQNAGLAPYLIILLDLTLPDGDGQDLIPWIRRLLPEVLIVVLSARDQDIDKIQALQNGADDYLTKPFTMGELLARLDAHLRRILSRPTEKDLHLAAWSLEEDGRRLLTPDGKEALLTSKEYQIMRQLLLHAGQIQRYQKLLLVAWGPKQLEQTHYLRIYIQRLREKIEPDPNRPRYLLTEAGVGYRLWLEPQEA